MDASVSHTEHNDMECWTAQSHTHGTMTWHDGQISLTHTAQ